MPRDTGPTMIAALLDVQRPPGLRESRERECHLFLSPTSPLARLTGFLVETKNARHKSERASVLVTDRELGSPPCRLCAGDTDCCNPTDSGRRASHLIPGITSLVTTADCSTGRRSIQLKLSYPIPAT